MKSTESFINEGKAQWNKVKADMEELNVQLALGRNEAKDAFEREWKKFSGFMEEQSHHLRRQSFWVGNLLKKMEERSRSIQRAVKQDMPESEKGFSTWREGTLRFIYELEFIIDELFPVLNDSEKELLSSFRIKMELYSTRLVQISFAELATLNIEATELAEKAGEILVWRENDTEHSREKIQRFGTDISKSFEHMKSAFSGLLK